MFKTRSSKTISQFDFASLSPVFQSANKQIPDAYLWNNLGTASCSDLMNLTWQHEPPSKGSTELFRWSNTVTAVQMNSDVPENK